MGVTKMKAIVIGAGFSGAACARKLAENGFEVTVIEKNTHIGGNAYDEYQCGAYVHRYGPHIFLRLNQQVSKHRISFFVFSPRHSPNKFGSALDSTKWFDFPPCFGGSCRCSSRLCFAWHAAMTTPMRDPICTSSTTSTR